MEGALFLKYLEEIVPNEATFLLISFLELAEEIEYNRFQTIYAKGSTVAHLAFLEHGSVMASKVLEDRLIGLRFWKSGEMICLTHSLFWQSPLNNSIEALEDCKLKMISRSKLIQFMSDHTTGWQVVGAILYNEHKWLEQRLKSFTMASSEERYRDFGKTYVKFFGLVKSEYISSYLGISNSTLNRLKLTNKK